MLTGIHPLLTGTVLRHLDAMGHSDTVLVCDAHFPAERIVGRVVEMPAATAPEVVLAIRSVLPLDAPVAIDLMDADGAADAVHTALKVAGDAPSDAVRMLSRQSFYDAGAGATFAIRTGEVRPFGNALLHKGIVETRAVLESRTLSAARSVAAVPLTRDAS